MFVIGTAGHVDHGKSTLVQALTGIDPDRLVEEKAREMTIDLGFAWLTLPGIEAEVGVVDVPGHRDFIENMLAGVGGIDLAMLVISADEGVMPQTLEHLAILDLLTIRSGIVVLTKTDLIDDEDWLELVQLEVAETLEGTVMEGVPIVAVSAKSGVGLDKLRHMLSEHLLRVGKRKDNGRARLPIDRVFSLSGFGTVVTGTLLDGRLQTGDSVEIQPTGLKGRIRGLQSHRTKRDEVEPGSRVAVNVTGIDRDQLIRGNVLTAEGVLNSTILFDAIYRQLPNADAPFKHNQDVKLFVGSSEVQARTRLLGKDEIVAGESGWVQFALKEPVAVMRGDRFIVRRPSPASTIGGGQVLDPFPGRKHRRFRPDVIARLQTLEKGTPGDLLLQKLVGNDPVNVAKFKRSAGMDDGRFEEALAELFETERIIRIDKQIITWTKFKNLSDDMNQLVRTFHRDHPLRLGIPLEEVRSRLKVQAVVLQPIIAQSVFVADGAVLREADHSVVFTEMQNSKIDKLMQQFVRAGINSPNVKDVKSAVGDDLYFALIDLGRMKQISDDVVYRTEDYNRFRGQIIDYIKQNGEITAPQVRDLFDTSRKYAIGFLEHLDYAKVTRRVGDGRQLAKIS
ncbi:MAG: selenocysteine-specific elongation factor [Cellvibrionaceae bacterium]|jgi:selenocysteine-specific elongation factor